MDNPVYYMDPDGMWPTDPVKGFINRAKAYVRQKVAEKINEKVGEVKDFVVGYVNQKIDNGKKAVKDFFTIESSSSSKGKTNSDTGLGFGVDLKVKNKDNVQDGLVEKAKGDRNTNQVEIDEFLIMNQPQGSRGQTPLTATGVSENTTSSNTSSNTSTMENGTNSDSDFATVKRHDYSATDKSAFNKSTLQVSVGRDTVVKKGEEPKVKSMNQQDSIKAAEIVKKRNGQ